MLINALNGKGTEQTKKIGCIQSMTIQYFNIKTVKLPSYEKVQYNACIKLQHVYEGLDEPHEVQYKIYYINVYLLTRTK